MEGERFAPPPSSSSRENPRALVSGLIVDRFRSMLRENDDVVEIYEELLSELTINSKPIITELTIIAGEQMEYGDGIADVICGRILEVPEDQKLPSLYLLDSIVKNIGREYVNYFSLRLPKVFSEAYNQVNSNMHRAMRHLFGTWSQVFPSSVLRKIEDKLQFTSSENKLPAGLASARNSESPHPSHGIHVNPKYLEAQRQFQHASVMQVTGAQKIVQTAECDEDGSRRLASVCPKGSGASPYFQDTEHAIGNSSRLKGHGHSSSTQYGSYNIDHSEVVSLHNRKSKVGSPQSAAACTSVAEAEGPNHHLNDKVSMPLSPRTRPGRSASPTDDRLTGDSSPWMAADRASAPYSQLGFEPGGAVKQNGLVNRSVQFDVGVSQLDASTAYDPNIRYGKKHPRELIDTYGNYRGQITSLEKPPKPQRVKMNGINGEATTRNWKSFEEEEYVWEDMSPTLADRIGKNSLPLLGPNSGSLSRRFGLNRPDSSILEHDLRGNNLQNHTKLHSSDAAVSINDDRISGVRFGHGAIRTKPPDGRGVQSEQFQHQSSLHVQDPGKFPYNFQHRSQEFSSDSWERSPQFIPSAITTAVNGQKPPAAYDNTPGIHLPFQRLPDFSSGSEYAETSVPEKHLVLRSSLPSVAPITLPPVYKSQPLPLNPSPPHLKPLNGPVLRGPNPPMFSAQQHFQGSYKETSISNNVLPMYHQQSGLVHSNLQIHEQGNGIKTQSQDAHVGYVPSVPAQLSSHFLTQPLNSLQTQVQGVPVGSLPSSFSGLTNSIAMYTSATSLPRPGGILPPLPPGPPPGSSQVGPASQNSGSLISGSPVSAFSGLISTLMAQGLISLTPPGQLEEASRELEFKTELLKVRHESAIDALYGNLPRQCTTCGLRFKCQEEHSSHMDWHVTKNRISKNRKQKPSRKWFVNTKEWLSGAETVGTDVVPFLPTETALEKKEDEEMAVPADENQTECALCGEPFEDFYSDEADEWMYKGAVYLNAPNGQMGGLDRSHLGPIVHAKCRSDTNDGP